MNRRIRNQFLAHERGGSSTYRLGFNTGSKQPLLPVIQRVGQRRMSSCVRKLRGLLSEHKPHPVDVFDPDGGIVGESFAQPGDENV